MRPLRALGIYLIAVFLGGALLAPWLWRMAQAGAHLWPSVANAPFHRFADRSFLIIALAGLWPLLKALGATSRREIGLVSPHGQSRKLAAGLLLGLISLALAAAIEIAAGERHLNLQFSAGKILGALAGAAVTAAAVATLEEILFRGGVFAGLRRIMPWPAALGIASMIYALVHFLQRAEITGPIRWDSGLQILPQMFAGFFDWHQLIPGFLNLTVVGVLLGLAFQRTGNLYCSIGLHAGWIFCLKIYGTLTMAASLSHLAFWGTGKLIDGWLAFFVLCGAGLAFPFLPLEPARRPHSRA